MIKEILDLILIGEFDLAYEKEIEMNKNISNSLFDISYDLANIAMYSYYNYKIAKRENAEDHYQASLILSLMLNYYNGAYDMSLYHAKKAIELDPNNLGYKEYILFFHYNPDLTASIDKEKFKNYAFELLDSDPNNVAAKTFLQYIGILKEE